MRHATGRPRDDFDFQNILYEKAEGIARVTIDRPEVYNALDWPTLREMAAAFEDASFDDRVDVLVLTGAGEDAFCTGADLKEQEEYFLDRPRDYWKWMGAFIDAHDRLKNIGKPTIARLNGIVVGGGNEFNIACDLAVAADDITLRQIGTARGSVPAGGATQWLPLLVGDRRAREILWLSEPYTAQQAVEWGWINKAVPREQLDEAVDEYARKLQEKLPAIMRYTKEQTNFWRNLAWGLTINHARDWLTEHTASWEVYEGMKSFKEKRMPDTAAIRARAAEGGFNERLWGAWKRTCPECGAEGLPSDHRFCGVCGTELGEEGSDE